MGLLEREEPPIAWRTVPAIGGDPTLVTDTLVMIFNGQPAGRVFGGTCSASASGATCPPLPANCPAHAGAPCARQLAAAQLRGRVPFNEPRQDSAARARQTCTHAAWRRGRASSARRPPPGPLHCGWLAGWAGSDARHRAGVGGAKQRCRALLVRWRTEPLIPAFRVSLEAQSREGPC